METRLSAAIDDADQGVSLSSFVYKTLFNLLLTTPNQDQHNPAEMSLTAKDKSTVKAFWARVSDRVEDIGSDALSR